MLGNLNMAPKDFVLKGASKTDLEFQEMPTIKKGEFPKWVEGQVVKDEEEEKAVKAGGKSTAPVTMTRPKAPKRKQGKRM